MPHFFFVQSDCLLKAADLPQKFVALCQRVLRRLGRRNTLFDAVKMKDAAGWAAPLRAARSA